ncbi:MAG: type restriction enzyme subunit [Chloroflexota bacterium]|jgi:type I restriction enzyme R subunit|nr:type restriction enzyme subunit [Chloroflexota bacterium]
MTPGGERESVQRPFVQYATEVGWHYLHREQAEMRRGGDAGLIFTDTLVPQLENLNPQAVNRDRAEELARRVVRSLPTIRGNLEVWEHLRGIKTVFVQEDNRERSVRFLDVDNPSNNVFQVTDEWSYRSAPDTEAVRFDVVLLINGIPIVMLETKAARDKDGLAKAIADIRAYHGAAPEQLALMQLFGATHIHGFRYGATWNTDGKNIYDWRAEKAGNYEELVKAFVDPARILRVVSDFIVFPLVDGELSKFVLRPHQMRAADKVVERSKDPTKSRGLIWHTQGSGKTYTMLTAAKLILGDVAVHQPTVMVIVDRTELEGQWETNMDALGFGDFRVANTKDQLRKLLASGWHGLILCMIHKFEDLPANMRTESTFFVLVDEAHRSMEGTLGTYLMAALPNATFIGFTGTPIDRTAHGKGTFKTFGRDDPSGFTDKYSMKESITDGTTVPLNYSLAPNDMLVDRATLEAEFLKVAELEGVSDIETLNKVLERAVTLRSMMKNASRVDRIAKYIAEHFTSNVDPMGYKAFLVAVDQEACGLYKDALDRYLPPDYSEVIISGSGEKGQHPLKRFDYDENKELAIRKAFRMPDGLPKILIVTAKLLTGFDAPVLYAMYLDKPMRDHVLLQAIARVNRPYDDADGHAKKAGLVLDFVGILDKLEDALNFDSQDVSGVLTGLGELQKHFAELIAVGKEAYLAIGRGLEGDKEVEAVVEYFRDQGRRDELQEFISELENLFEILSPDAFLRPYLDDYQRLMEVAATVRAAFYQGLDVDKSFLRKTGLLVREHTVNTYISGSGKVHELTSQGVDELVNGQSPDTVKVINLLKTLHEAAEKERALNPYLISIGARADEIAAKFRDRQMTTEDTLKAAEKLAREAVDAAASQKESGLSQEAFAVRWFLRGKGVQDQSAEDIATAAGIAFGQYPLWRVRSDEERAVRTKLYAALIRAGVDSDGYVEDILHSLRRVHQ